MIEPTGPLPPSVYWRRRAFAAGVCVFAVVLLAWIIGGLVGAADDQPVHGTAGSRELAAAPSSPPPSTRPAGAPSSTTSPTTAPPAASPTTAPTGRPTTRPAPPASTPPGPAKPCPDAVIKVVAQPGQPSYQVGRRPLLHLLVVNTGKVPCTRDVSRKLRELVITSADGRTRLWSSKDCYGPPATDTRTLAPGKPLEFSLNWAGRTSAPGCPTHRTTVPAGSYRVIGKLGALTGPPVALTMTP
ncbi:hypothetical protein [Actinophytocola sp.]|jgi:hypothetical protein|uniref:hypothetical protein n=1 Tax=Actinophytocola sp. TaxID=1872138 RepID=UPI002ED83662